MNFTFKKKEHLCSKILIDKVFNEGSRMYFPLFKVIWLTTSLPENIPIQLLITVPKRSFKRSYKRNLIKRRIKEAYRKNKHNLFNGLIEAKIQIAVVIIYISPGIADYSLIEENMNNLIKSLSAKFPAHS